MGGENTANTYEVCSRFKSGGHVVEVTAKIRLFLVTSITPVSTQKMVESGRRHVTGLSASRTWKNPD